MGKKLSLRTLLFSGLLLLTTPCFTMEQDGTQPPLEAQLLSEPQALLTECSKLLLQPSPPAQPSPDRLLRLCDDLLKQIILFYLNPEESIEEEAVEEEPSSDEDNQTRFYKKIIFLQELCPRLDSVVQEILKQIFKSPHLFIDAVCFTQPVFKLLFQAIDTPNIQAEDLTTLEYGIQTGIECYRTDVVRRLQQAYIDKIFEQKQLLSDLLAQEISYPKNNHELLTALELVPRNYYSSQALEDDQVLRFQSVLQYIASQGHTIKPDDDRGRYLIAILPDIAQDTLCLLSRTVESAKVKLIILWALVRNIKRENFVRETLQLMELYQLVQKETSHLIRTKLNFCVKHNLLEGVERLLPETAPHNYCKCSLLSDAITSANFFNQASVLLVFEHCEPELPNISPFVIKALNKDLIGLACYILRECHPASFSKEWVYSHIQQLVMLAGMEHLSPADITDPYLMHQRILHSEYAELLPYLYEPRDEEFFADSESSDPESPYDSEGESWEEEGTESLEERRNEPSEPDNDYFYEEERVMQALWQREQRRRRH